jgi:hypothetical protein
MFALKPENEQNFKRSHKVSFFNNGDFKQSLVCFSDLSKNVDTARHSRVFLEKYENSFPRNRNYPNSFEKFYGSKKHHPNFIKTHPD